MKLTIIGIGQGLRGDDAAGPEAVRRWAESFPCTAERTDLHVQTAELPGLGLLEMLAGHDAAVLVDAVKSAAKPGTIHRLALEDLASFGSEARSAHGWGVAETLEMSRQLNLAHPAFGVRFVGIEAQQMELGQPMSEAVERAMPPACQAIQDEVEALLSMSGPR